MSIIKFVRRNIRPIVCFLRLFSGKNEKVRKCTRLVDVASLLRHDSVSARHYFLLL